MPSDMGVYIGIALYDHKLEIKQKPNQSAVEGNSDGITKSSPQA